MPLGESIGRADVRGRQRPHRRAFSAAYAVLFGLVACSTATWCFSAVASFVGPTGVLRRRLVATRRARGGEESLPADSEIVPLADYVLVKIGKPEETSKGGIVLPTRQKPQEGDIVAVGPGQIAQRSGEAVPVSIAAGSHAVYSSIAYFDKFKVGGIDHGLLREIDILATWGGSEPSLADIKVPRGRVLVLVIERNQETDAGLVLSKGVVGDKSNVGLVLAIGEGEVDAEGKTQDPGFEKGDVVRFRYGDDLKLDIGEGKEKFMSVRLSQCMAKAKPADSAPAWTGI